MAYASIWKHLLNPPIYSYNWASKIANSQYLSNHFVSFSSLVLWSL